MLNVRIVPPEPTVRTLADLGEDIWADVDYGTSPVRLVRCRQGHSVKELLNGRIGNTSGNPEQYRVRKVRGRLKVPEAPLESTESARLTLDRLPPWTFAVCVGTYSVCIGRVTAYCDGVGRVWIVEGKTQLPSNYEPEAFAVLEVAGRLELEVIDDAKS